MRIHHILLLLILLLPSLTLGVDFENDDQLYGWDTGAGSQFYQTWADHVLATKAELGTAAVYNVGILADNIVQLNGAGELPFTLDMGDLTDSSVDGEHFVNVFNSIAPSFTPNTGDMYVDSTFSLLVYNGASFEAISGSGGSVAIADITDWPAGVVAAEVGYLDNASSELQAQIDLKAPTANPTFTGEIGIGAVNVSEAELGILEGATASTIELNFSVGVTSGIQAQIDGISVGSPVTTEPPYRDTTCTKGQYAYSADGLTKYDCVATDLWMTSTLTNSMSDTPTNPVAVVTPSSKDFGEISGDTTQVFVVTNTGDADLTMQNPAYTLVGDAEFTQTANDCNSAVIVPYTDGVAANETCEIEVTFAGPAAVGWNSGLGSDGNLEGYWSFEEGALTTDSSGNSNTLTNSASLVADTGNYKEGSASADIGDTDWYYITDTDLSAGFPLKTGDTNKKISVAAWFYHIGTTNDGLVNKHDGDSQWSYGLRKGASGYITYTIGVGLGSTDTTLATTTTTLTTNRWYHIVTTYDDSTGDWKLVLYDSIADTNVEDLSGTEGSGGIINVEDSDWVIGARNSAGDYGFDGLMDEVLIFGDVLTAQEITDIRNGDY